MPELPPQIYSYILADKSCYAHGQDKIYEVSGMQQMELAEESPLQGKGGAVIQEKRACYIDTDRRGNILGIYIYT